MARKTQTSLTPLHDYDIYIRRTHPYNPTVAMLNKTQVSKHNVVSSVAPSTGLVEASQASTPLPKGRGAGGEGAASERRQSCEFTHVVLDRIYFLIQKESLTLLLLALFTVGISTRASAQQKRATEEESQTLRVNVDLVNVLFTVTEGNRLIANLNKEDFLVEEDGKRQQVSYFSREVTLPLTLAILIDTSPSVQTILEIEKQTAVEFLSEVLHKEDLALVMNFDRSVSLLQDFTSDIRRLRKAIQSVAIGSGTSVHDAVFLAADEKLKPETGRKAIILISDGADTTSKLKIREAIEAAQRADVIIYAISNRSGMIPMFGMGGDDGTLKKYAEATGGKAFFPSKPQDFKKAFDAIQEELRSQYIITYNSSNTLKDGNYRLLKISVPNNKNLKVRAKKGYYAAKS